MDVLLAILIFVFIIYLLGRALGAGLKAGGNRWQTGKNDANINTQKENKDV